MTKPVADAMLPPAAVPMMAGQQLAAPVQSMVSAWQGAVDASVRSLGLEVISVERSGGLLRVTIDWPWQANTPLKRVSAENCEQVTRQLQYVLEAHAVDYQRLEVSSPGIDRVLRNPNDLLRFVGEVVDLSFKAPIGQAGQAQIDVSVAASRKKFRGILAQGADAGQWLLQCQEPPLGTREDGASPKAPKGQKKQAVQHYSVQFVWAEVRDAHLAPIVNFKGRSAPSVAESEAI